MSIYLFLALAFSGKELSRCIALRDNPKYILLLRWKAYKQVLSLLCTKLVKMYPFKTHFCRGISTRSFYTFFSNKTYLYNTKEKENLEIWSKDKITLRKGMGNPMSTFLFSLLFVESVMLVSLFKIFLRVSIPSFVSMSHLSVRSLVSVFPDLCSTINVIFSEFLILHIVLVDSRLFPLKIRFPKILLMRVDFPALVSPVTVD